MTTSRKINAKVTADQVTLANKLSATAARMVATLSQSSAELDTAMATLDAQYRHGKASLRGQKLAALLASVGEAIAYKSKEAFQAGMGAAIAKAVDASTWEDSSKRTAKSQLEVLYMAKAHGADFSGYDYQGGVQMGRWFLAHQEVEGYPFTDAHVAAGLDTAQAYAKPERTPRQPGQPGTSSQQNAAIKRAFNACGVAEPEERGIKAVAAVMTSPKHLRGFLSWYASQAEKGDVGETGKAEPKAPKAPKAEPDKKAALLAMLAEMLA